MLAGLLAVSALSVWNSSRAAREMARMGIERPLESYFFAMASVMGVVFAAFISLFLSAELADGAVRNKLIVGHSRASVYLADYLVCLGACLAFVAAWFLGGLTGLLCIEPFSMSPGEVLVYLLIAAGFTASFAALFVLISLLCDNKALTVILSLALWLGLVLLAGAFYDRLHEPEMSGGVMYQNGAFQEVAPQPNPLYLAGLARTVCQCLLEFLPTGQAQLVYGVEVQAPVRQLASAVNEQLRLLRSQRQRYQQGDREVKEAIANLSHDLRTPLTTISGYLELMGQQQLPPDAARYLTRIGERTQAMQTLTEELFRYSLTVSAPPLQLQPVDLRRALEETLLSLYGAFAQKGIAPVLDLAEPGSRFLLDAGALGRVLNNILANALKYSTGDLTVTLNREGVMTFSNRTAGMAAVDVQKLFDRYYTVETAQNSTGLGLSIARRLTGQMGGRIGAAYHNGCLTVTVDFSAARLPEDAPKTNL